MQKNKESNKLTLSQQYYCEINVRCHSTQYSLLFDKIQPVENSTWNAVDSWIPASNINFNAKIKPQLIYSIWNKSVIRFWVRFWFVCLGWVENRSKNALNRAGNLIELCIQFVNDFKKREENSWEFYRRDYYCLENNAVWPPLRKICYVNQPILLSMFSSSFKYL